MGRSRKSTISAGNVSQGMVVKKWFFNLLLGGGSKSSSSQLQQQDQVLLLDDDDDDHQYDYHDHGQRQERRSKTKPPLSPVLQALRGVSGGSKSKNSRQWNRSRNHQKIFSTNNNMTAGSSDGAALASDEIHASSSSRRIKQNACRNSGPPPVRVVTFPDHDGEGNDVHDRRRPKTDLAAAAATTTRNKNINTDVNVNVDVSMTSTINTTVDVENDDQSQQKEQEEEEWIAVFNDDHGDADAAAALFDEIDDERELDDDEKEEEVKEDIECHGDAAAAAAAASLVDVSHSTFSFPKDEQFCNHYHHQLQNPKQEQHQPVHVHVGISSSSNCVIVVQEEAPDEEVEIEFYYQNDECNAHEYKDEDENPSDCQDDDDDEGDEDNVFSALAENDPFLSNKNHDCCKSEQPLLPTSVPGPTGVTDFDDVFGFDNADKTVVQKAVAASTGAVTAMPPSSAAAASQCSNDYASPFKLAIEEEGEYGLFDNSDHHLSFLTETTKLRILQQPKLDLDDDDQEDNDHNEEQDHRQLLQDLQREAFSEQPVAGTSSNVSSGTSTDPQNSRFVVHMTSSYESFDVVKGTVENSKEERGQTSETDDVQEEGEEGEDEKCNLHKLYKSSENLIELEENVPTPIRGSQRKNRTSVLEDLGLAPTTASSSTSATSSTASTTSKSSERTFSSKTDTTDKTSTKSLTLCVDQYGPATFYKLLNDLKDNRNITELTVFRSWHSSNGCKRSTNDIIQLFDVIQSIEFLKVLKVSNFSGPELDGAICETHWCHPTVSNLQLHIRQGSISKQTLEQLAELPLLDELVMEMNESFPFHFALSSKSLTKLTIVANYFDLDNMHLMETINMLRGNRVLRSLVIEPPMKLRAFKLLAYSLRSNTTLEELTVSLIPSHLDNDSVNDDGKEAPNHCNLDDGFDDETSAAIEVANLLRTNSTLTCLKNKNSAFIKVGQKGAHDVRDALLGSNVVVDFTLFDEKEHIGFTKTKNAKLDRNKAVSEISLFKNLFSCSQIDTNVDLPKVEFPNVDLPEVDLPKVDLPNVDLPKMISNASASASATASATATVCEEVASESKIVLESVYQDYRDIGNSLQGYKDIGTTLVGDGMKAISGMSCMVDTMYKQFAL